MFELAAHWAAAERAQSTQTRSVSGLSPEQVSP
jgi:hypothetical protein